MWDTTYRPLKFADVLGQEGAVRVLQARLRNGSATGTSYIFSGGSGRGKTTLARIFARALLCEDLDPETAEPCNQCEQCEAILRDESVAFVERDAASQGTVEHVRGIVEDLPFAVLGAKKRIFLFDECFTEDTMLRTRHGLKSIKDIVDQRDNCEVLSFDPVTQQPVWQPITDWFCIPDLRDLLRLTFDSGVVLVVTPDQELFTNNRGWVPASQLTEEDDIVEAIL